MTDYEYIYQQMKKAHYSGWDDEELRKCVDMLPTLSRDEQLAMYRSKWIGTEKTLKDAIFNQLFKERIGERDRLIKAMTVDELIENLHDENGYGKFIVLEMIIDTLSATTKANQRWAEGKKKKMNKEGEKG